MLVEGNALSLRQLVPKSLLVEYLLLVLHDVRLQLLHVLALGQLCANFKLPLELSYFQLLLRCQVHILHYLGLGCELGFIEGGLVMAAKSFVDEVHANRNEEAYEASSNDHDDHLLLLTEIFLVNKLFLVLGLSGVLEVVCQLF